MKIIANPVFVLKTEMSARSRGKANYLELKHGSLLISLTVKPVDILGHIVSRNRKTVAEKFNAALQSVGQRLVFLELEFCQAPFAVARNVQTENVFILTIVLNYVKFIYLAYLICHRGLVFIKRVFT